MLGVYDYTVILTYISLWISIGGMMLSLNGHLDLAGWEDCKNKEG